jgi:hypothetical protein
MADLLIAIAAWIGVESSAPPPARPSVRLDYRVECVLDGVDDRLVVDVRVGGLDPSRRDLTFELPTWGEWIELDEYYVRRAVGTPPVVHDLENRFYWRPQLPAKWDGKLALKYEIPIVDVKSTARERRGLLPWRAGGYVSGFTINTLMRLLVGDARQDAARTLELAAPDGFHVACGWGGVASRTLKLAMPTDGDNSALLFGGVAALAKPAKGAKDAVTVAQFSTGADRTAAVASLLTKVRAAFAATTGVPPSGPEHAFLLEPGMGGTHTEGAISMGLPELEASGRFEVGTAHFIAHESFHAWLPELFPPSGADGGDGHEWFFEGFTDYVSLWHLVAIDAATPQQFADRLRLLQHLGQQSPSWGKVAFADPSVRWRDPDHETVAYKGARCSPSTSTSSCACAASPACCSSSATSPPRTVGAGTSRRSRSGATPTASKRRGSATSPARRAPAPTTTSSAPAGASVVRATRGSSRRRGRTSLDSSRWSADAGRVLLRSLRCSRRSRRMPAVHGVERG